MIRVEQMLIPSAAFRQAGREDVTGKARSSRQPTLLTNGFWVMLLFSAALSVMTCELLNSLNPDAWLPIVNLIISISMILLVELILTGIFKRLSWAMVSSQLLMAIISLVNYFKQYFRGDPVFAGDIVMVGDAGEIAEDLRYSLEPRLPLALLVLLAGIILATRSRRRIRQPVNRLLLTVAASFLLVVLVTGVIWNDTIRRDWLGVNDYSWNTLSGTRENGFLIPFARSMEDLLPPEPPKNTVPQSDYLIAAPSTEASSSSPNVIVVMSEAFSDLEHIFDLKTSEPVLPFFRSLQQSPNVIDGSLLVSVFGGGTCNTEFEFLTGSSMYYVNDGLVPYVSWFKKPTRGLADLFNQQGYRSIAIHPFLSSYYDRASVFPALGFSSFIAMEQFPAVAQKVHGNISDQEHVNQIIRTYEQKSADERLFLFTVTMQNHFPYDNAAEGLAALPRQIRLPDVKNAKSAELYLSLLRESDDALKSLVQYYEKANEPTLIVLFGDHLPGLSSGFRPFYQNFLGKSVAELDLQETRKIYQTPFLIWANYPLPEDNIDVTSPNFLSATVAELAKADLSPYYQYIGSLDRDIAAISNKILVLKDGTTVDRDHVPVALTEKLERYWDYQYDNVIRKRD